MSEATVKLLDDVIKDLEGKKDFPGRWCEYYSPECKEHLATYGDTHKDCGHKCEYCDKYKWTIDRAIHYGEKLGIPWNEILESWEEDRKYWFLNYYQEANQPKIDSDDVFVFESAEEMNKKVGTEFICPCCKGISTNPYECNTGKQVTKGKKCNWKAYGFLQSNLAFLYCKKERKGTKCFMPKALQRNGDIYGKT